jgi:acyl-CoA synthetase (NDP forming)
VAGFETPPPGPATAAQLRELQQNDQIVLDRNPIDVTLAGLQPELLRKTIATLMASPDYDAVVTVVGSSALANPTLAAGAIADCLALGDKPVLAYVSPHAPAVLASLNRGGAPAFAAPESFASVLSALYARTHRQPAAAAVSPGAPVAVGDLPRGSLNEAQAKTLFARFGVPTVRERTVADAAQGQAEATAMGARIVLKVLSGKITHKTEAGGVAVGVAAGDVGKAIGDMHARVLERTGIEPEGFLLQEMISGGTELILGYHRDPQLGPAILLGLGGVTAELFKDTALRLLPIDRPTAHEMIRSLKAWPLLDGYRGRPKADVQALEDAILAFAAMATQLDGELVEAEINPLFVLDAGQGVRAADGVAVLRDGD